MQPWKSKTLWFNAIVAIVALVVPGFTDIVVNNPVASVLIQAAINLVLRLVTKEPIALVSR